ncbi:rod shape-determining protein MreC [bacterium]|nr:MAG: rod shape-determining protein MreC [bacterium]
MVARSMDGIQSIRSVSLVVYSMLEEPLSSIRVYRQALSTNEQLQRKNILLQDEISRLRSVQAENESYRAMLGFRDTTQLPLIPVRIIGKNLTGINNSLTIDAGENSGIKKGMALVTADGLVGRVILTSGSYSEVMPIINSLFRASARVQGSRAYGLVQWDGESLEELQMLYVPKTVQVDSGAVIETSGYSLEFPPFLPIGTVISSQPEAGKETQVLTLRPSVSMYQIAEGFVIASKIDSTLLTLKEQAEQ